MLYEWLWTETKLSKLLKLDFDNFYVQQQLVAMLLSIFPCSSISSSIFRLWVEPYVSVETGQPVEEELLELAENLGPILDLSFTTV